MISYHPNFVAGLHLMYMLTNYQVKENVSKSACRRMEAVPIINMYLFLVGAVCTWSSPAIKVLINPAAAPLNI